MAATMAVPQERLDFSETITVVVGSEQKQCIIHKCLGIAPGSTFDVLSHQVWRNSNVYTMQFSDVEPNDFDIFMHWLYKGQCVLNPEPDVEILYNQLIRLYSFARRHQLRSFQNAVMTHTQKTFERTSIYPGPGNVNMFPPAWKELCPMQRFILRCWALWRTEDENSLGWEQGVTKSFLARLFEDMIQVRDIDWHAGSAAVMLPCAFLEHDDGAPRTGECYRAALADLGLLR